MKKIILVCVMTTLGFGAFAQNDSMHNNKDYDNNNNNNETMQDKNTGKQNQKNSYGSSECAVKMENGKMMKVVNKKTVALDKEMTLKNGAVVSVDGSVKTKDGQNMMMKEGDCMDFSGKMIEGQNSKMKGNKKDTRKASN